jgi:hypothetical protein
MILVSALAAGCMNPVRVSVSQSFPAGTDGHEMPGKRLLVLATVPVSDEVLREAVGEAPGAEIRVVAPASDISRLDWLTNAEDDARREAGEVASRSANEVGADAEVGDTDPVQAIEDALREWPADEVLVVTPPDDEATWLEQGAGEEAQSRFGVPVVQLRLGRG